MKLKSHITLATLLVAGMLVTGCQQLQQTAGAAGASQQVVSSGQQQAATTKPADGKTATTTTGGAAAGSHSHPAIPGCTNSVTHTHKFTDPKHTHSYGCKGGKGKVGAGKGGAGKAKGGVPKVKAKGKYKGPVKMDKRSKALMQQYQQR